MIVKLEIYLNEEVKLDKTDSADCITTIESIRDSIIKLSNDEPELIRNIINHQKHEIPNVIYTLPHGKSITIYGLKDNGSIAISSVFKNIINNRGIKIKNHFYKIGKKPSIENNITFLPQNNGKVNTYTTATPINIFNKHNHKVFKFILYKYFKDGRFDKNNKLATDGFYSEIKEYASRQIKDSIAYMTAQTLGKNKEDITFINDLYIEWESIRIVFRHFHSEEKKMPMVIGQFNTNFLLPELVGYKIGKGFGRLLLKENYKDLKGAK